VQNTTLLVQENTTSLASLADIVIYDSDSVKFVDVLLDDDYGNTFTIVNKTIPCNHIAKSVKSKSRCDGTLQLNRPLNYEVKESYQLRIRIVDRGHSATFLFALNVTDVNDSPTNIFINNKKTAGVMENQMGIRIGKLQTRDEDIGQSHQYQITSSDFGLFEIQGEYLVLQTYSQLNYESVSSYKLNISSTDNGDPIKTVINELEVKVLDGNDPVKMVTLTNYTIMENSIENTIVAKILIDDEDTDNPTSITHPCVSDSGRYIVNKKHDIIVSPNGQNMDYESFKTFNYTITCFDGNLKSKWTFEMTIADKNEAPYKIALSNSTILENRKPPFSIGKLSASDPDNSEYQLQTFQYSLLNHQDKFRIEGDTLRSIVSFDYEIEKSVDVDIRVEDSGAPLMVYTEKKRLTVINVNDQPSDILVISNYFFITNFIISIYFSRLLSIECELFSFFPK